MVNITILDVDNTLIDIRPALHHLTCEHPNKPAFFDHTIICPPHQYALDYARKHYEEGQKLVLFTARREKYRLHTTVWLDKHFHLPYLKLSMCRNDDDSGDVELKKRMLTELKSEGFNPTHAIDDTVEILDLWRENNINVTPMPLLRDLNGQFPIDSEWYKISRGLTTSS